MILYRTGGWDGDHDALAQRVPSRHARALKAASDGPVIVTADDKPAHVLLTIEEYEALTGKPDPALADALPRKEGQPSLAELLAVPEDEYFDYEFPRIEIHIRPADFS